MLSTSLIRDLQKALNSYYASQISILESEHPHQYNFNEFQFDYKGVPGQALLHQYFFQQRYKHNFIELSDVHLILPPLLSVVAQTVQLKHDFFAVDLKEYFYLFVILDK